MIPTTPNRDGTTANVHDDGDLVRRSVTIRRPLEDVRSAWNAAGITGDAQFSPAPGALGTEVRVTAPSGRHSIVPGCASTDWYSPATP